MTKLIVREYLRVSRYDFKTGKSRTSSTTTTFAGSSGRSGSSTPLPPVQGHRLLGQPVRQEGAGEDFFDDKDLPPDLSNRTCSQCGRDREPEPFEADDGFCIAFVCAERGLHSAVDPLEGRR